MNNVVKKWLWLLILAVPLLSGCNDNADNPQPADENELITTLTLRFTQQGVTSPQSQTITFRDVDGDGGSAPVITGNVTLRANQTYTLDVAQLLDESKTPTLNILEEVEEESDEHLFVFTPNPTSLFTYTYGDKDQNNLPIGITGTVRTGAAGTGTVTVQLRHQPGTKNGTPAPGDDDLNVQFNITVAN
ncbi:hypothetical protein BN8_04323 [Fibrisoma limi BUZ 3]|uniref:Type 1 periplasmic binding fold superfamily protein n=1 Tax=Fibrisoma limi BUZ 3 TaxID=1185876 RepID=I2GMG1_9BACT|nr:hypothetical protein [Fibrisoma limi]CCH55089.1 hypothetical protein BN8_04323 [Fibrisoma limi BUZ 3]